MSKSKFINILSESKSLLFDALSNGSTFLGSPIILYINDRPRPRSNCLVCIRCDFDSVNIKASWRCKSYTKVCFYFPGLSVLSFHLFFVVVFFAF